MSESLDSALITEGAFSFLCKARFSCPYFSKEDGCAAFPKDQDPKPKDQDPKEGCDNYSIYIHVIPSSRKLTRQTMSICH